KLQGFHHRLGMLWDGRFLWVRKGTLPHQYGRGGTEIVPGRQQESLGHHHCGQWHQLQASDQGRYPKGGPASGVNPETGPVGPLIVPLCHCPISKSLSVIEAISSYMSISLMSSSTKKGESLSWL